MQRVAEPLAAKGRAGGRPTHPCGDVVDRIGDTVEAVVALDQADGTREEVGGAHGASVPADPLTESR